MKIDVRQADYADPADARDIGFLLNAYASDRMGGGEPLADFIRENIATELSKLPHAFSILCHVNNKPAGLTNCFEAFSTFHCKPLINIHDIVVVNEFRGCGISQQLLTAVEDIARKKGCCKITLEVLAGNTTAKNAYRKFGFNEYALHPAMGTAAFWQKGIDPISF